MRDCKICGGSIAHAKTCPENPDVLRQVDAGVRPTVAWFAKEMERILKANDHKGKLGWEDEDIDYLYERLYVDEMEELKRAYNRGDEKKILHECIDVANFAMMLADRMRQRLT